MKAVVVIVLIAAGIGWVRHGRWSELKAETVCLQSMEGTMAPGVVGKLLPAGEEQVLSREIPESLGPDLLRLLEFQAAGANGEEREQLTKSVASQLAQLDHEVIAALIRRIQGDASVSEESKEKVADVCFVRLSQTNPAEAMRLAALIPDAKIDPNWFPSIFTMWCARRPAEALKWFDEMEENGSPMAKDGMLIPQVLVEQARIDPAGALERALSHESTGLEEKCRSMGSQVVSSLLALEEQRSFLIALERAGRKAPDSRLLAAIRDDSILQLSCSLAEWPFDDAMALVEAGFHSDERLLAAKQAGSGIPRYETERWAEWISGIQAPAGPEHPLIHAIDSWTIFDPQAAGRWLANEPEGALKDTAMIVYLSGLDSINPETAISCLAGLPDSPEKRAALKRVCERQKGE